MSSRARLEGSGPATRTRISATIHPTATDSSMTRQKTLCVQRNRRKVSHVCRSRVHDDDDDYDEDDDGDDDEILCFKQFPINAVYVFYSAIYNRAFLR